MDFPHVFHGKSSHDHHDKSIPTWLQVEYTDGRDTLTFCDSHSDPGCHGLQAKRLKVQIFFGFFLGGFMW